jgi:hypothetical protein
MIDSYRSQVDSDFIRLVESAMNKCRDEFDSNASFMVPALKNSLTRLNEICSFSSGVAYAKERNAKKFQDAVDNRNPDVVVKHQGSTEPKKVPPFWIDVPVDKKSHDEVNKDLGSTVWIDEQLEFTLPEQPTEEPSSPISPDGSLDLPAELLATTHVIEYSPNCAQRFLIRIPGYGKPLIDKRRLGTTGDAIGYGNNPEDAFKQALAKREEQKGAKQ